MDVVKDNFAQALVQLKDALTTADYVAFDAEFSGLGTQTYSHSQREMNELQMAHNKDQINYARSRHAVSQYLPLQFGACTFHWDEANQRYTARPFNFNIFPDDAIDKPFMASTSALRFLMNNKFDFNKMIAHGVPYLSHYDAEMLRNKPFTPSAIDISTIDNKDFIFNHIETVLDWMADLPESGNSLEISVLNRLQAIVLAQEIPARFDELVVDITESNYSTRTFKIRVTRLRGDARLAHTRAMADAEREKREIKLVEQIGFRACVDAIATCGVPVIGHNMFLDMLHTYERFFRPLPRDLAQFRHEWKSAFRQTVDTKFISTAMKSHFPGLQFTTMSAVTEYFCGENATVGVEFPGEFTRYLDGQYDHEAAYDAYLTGHVLANLTHKLLTSKAMADGKPAEKISKRVNFDSLKQLDLVNRVFLMRMDNELNLDEQAGPAVTPMPSVLASQNAVDATLPPNMRRIIGGHFATTSTTPRESMQQLQQSKRAPQAPARTLPSRSTSAKVTPTNFGQSVASARTSPFVVSPGEHSQSQTLSPFATTTTTATRRMHSVASASLPPPASSVMRAVLDAAKKLR